MILPERWRIWSRPMRWQCGILFSRSRRVFISCAAIYVFHAATSTDASGNMGLGWSWPSAQARPNSRPWRSAAGVVHRWIELIVVFDAAIRVQDEKAQAARLHIAAGDGTHRPVELDHTVMAHRVLRPEGVVALAQPLLPGAGHAGFDRLVAMRVEQPVAGRTVRGP